MPRLTAQSSASNSNGHNSHPAFPEATTTKPEEAWSDDEEEGEYEMADPSNDTYPTPRDPTLLPGGCRDLALIGLQAFGCGIGFASGLIFTLLLLYIESAWWRLPAFLTCLSLFHFLEYWTTARWNVPLVRASSFLLYNNGKAYTAAHTLATLEIIISQFFPSYQSFLVWPYTVALGLALVLFGQVIRSTAMAQAGTNFAHIMVTQRKEDHELVTDGLYAWSRHPSYFGFFWWAMGTQFLVGNKVCLTGYAFALWVFFEDRIQREEKHLVGFFGNQYVEYRKRTGTRIPFVP